MKIAVFGTGKYYQKFKIYLQEHDLVALVDNDSNLWGTPIDGICVIPPIKLLGLKYDKIFILIEKYIEIYEQLLKIGIKSKDICNYRELYECGLYLPYVQYGIEKIKPNRILFVTPFLTLTGAPWMLYHLAICVANLGYSIGVASMRDGPLRKFFLEKNITVYIDPNIEHSSVNSIPYADLYDIYVANTIFLSHLLTDDSLKQRTIVWLHEPAEYYSINPNYCVKQYISQWKNQNIKVCAISEVARKAFLAVRNDYSVDLLYPGIPDRFRINCVGKNRSVDLYTSKVAMSRRFIFAVIGAVVEFKGQHRVLRAMAKLNKEIRCASEIWLVGDISLETKSYLKMYAEDMDIPHLRIWGSLDREEIYPLFSQIDAVVIPSYSETLSISAIEAMMFSTPVILSQDVGISQYLTDGVNAFIFENSIEGLSKKMEECFLCTENKEIGKNGRIVYKRNFMMPSKDLWNIIAGE